MVFKIKSYIQFLWHSKNEHAVHSPFVFNLITQCFYDVNRKPEYAILNQNRISIIEKFGINTSATEKTGYKINKSNLLSKNQSKLLFRIVHYFNAIKILEIGNSCGLATSAMALHNKKAEIMVFLTEIRVRFDKLDVENNAKENATVSKIQSLDDFNGAIKNKKFDLIFFNSDNYQNDILKYFTLLIPTQTNDSVWIFDKIHQTPKMEEIWKIIQNHQTVTVSIDTFDFGIVFFRKEQSKQHFIIRV